MAIHKLNPRKVASAGPGKYEDGGGLRLVVSKTGAKKWVVRAMHAGKRKEFGLGGYPSVGLAEARKTAEEYRRLYANGIDPAEERKKQLLAATVQTPTFTACAARYIRSHRRGWKNAKHARQWVSTLKTYARPFIGIKKIDDITTQDVLSVLQPIWNTKNETAKRLQGRIENINALTATYRLFISRLWALIEFHETDSGKESLH